MDWFNCSDRLPEDKFKKYLVKKENGEQIPVFFMPDKMQWLTDYGMKTSFWMEISSGKLVHNVELWMPLPAHAKE